MIVSVLPATRETRHLFTRERFEHCKPNAILFNVGRGTAIHTQDLLDALAAGKLAHAVLDVFEQEPLPADSQLWATPNLIITPHITWASEDGVGRLIQGILGNLEAYYAGRPVNVVS